MRREETRSKGSIEGKSSFSDDTFNAMIERSVSRILANQTPSGAIVASPDFTQYHYSWLRDGSFVAYALDVVGAHEAAERYHARAADADLSPLASPIPREEFRRLAAEFERLLAEVEARRTARRST